MQNTIGWLSRALLLLLVVIALYLFFWPAPPNVPTMREQGYDVIIDSWIGLFVPVRTPAAFSCAILPLLKDLAAFRRCALFWAAIWARLSPELLAPGKPETKF